jgi:hypothetical protein
MNNYLEKLYLNENSPTFFAGINALYREAKKKYPKIKTSDVRKFLTNQTTYTLHKPYRKYKPLKTISAGLDCDHQIDLCDMLRLKKTNKYKGYILTCIDVLSKYTWAFPIKTKEPKEVVKAYQNIIDEGRKPWRVFSDKGNEFKGEFAELLKKNGIKQIFMENPITKAGVVERFNRTLKTRLYKYFTENNTTSWIKILPKIVTAINHSINRMHGMRPVDVTHGNDQIVHERLYGEAKTQMVINRRRKDDLQIGDLVRITIAKGIYAKGYTQSRSGTIYVITERQPRDRIVYKLRAIGDNEDIIGIFYKEELSKVAKNGFLEARIARKRRSGRK